MKFLRLFGFSLIELLVSISIISVLISGALFILKPLDYIKRSRDSRRLSDLKVVQTALEQYYGTNNNYPATGDFTFGSAWSPYSRLVPNDPDSSKTYCYNYTAPNYLLCATLENPGGSPFPPSGSCSAYNYCLSNPF